MDMVVTARALRHAKLQTRLCFTTETEAKTLKFKTEQRCRPRKTWKVAVPADFLMLPVTDMGGSTS